MSRTDLLMAFERMIAQCRSVNQSETTIKGVTVKVKNFIGFTGDGEVNRASVKRFQLDLGQRVKGDGMPLSPQYINRYISAVRNFLTFLKQEGLIKRDLAEELIYVKEPKTLPTSVLAHEQMVMLLESVETSTSVGFRDRLMMELLYSSGLRNEELVNIDIHDVDVKEKTVRVMGKGQKERLVVFGEVVAKLLEEYLLAIRPFWKGASETSAMFLTNRKQRMSTRQLRYLVKEHAKRVGLENVTPHTFRRSTTTELVRSNANLYHVKELLGHDGLDTLKHYAKLNVADLRGMMEEYHPRNQAASINGVTAVDES